MLQVDNGASALIPQEARSGLPPWIAAELPLPPRPTGLGWLRAVGPGIIVLGVSIGSVEFLLGPAVFVRYGFTLLWAVIVAVIFQTIFNTEVMRYTLATGEPVCTGFMRTRPSSTLWAWVYAGLYFCQIGWPVWAGTAAGAIFFVLAGRLPNTSDNGAIYTIAIAAFLVCVAILSVGRRIERTLELLNWILVVTIFTGLAILTAVFVSRDTWAAAGAGMVGFDPVAGRFNWLPAGADFVLISGLVAFAGSGGVTNLTLSNWARDRGYGMGQHAGFIPSLSSEEVVLASTGFAFSRDDEAMVRWRGWWRIVNADQWGVFCIGAILGMLLPAVLYVTFLPSGSDIQGLGISAALASAVGAQSGPWLGAAIAFLGAWILFKTQLDNLEGLVRAVTDILWTGSARVRRCVAGDVRRIYYGVLSVVVCWAFVALRLAQPIALLRISANIAGVVFVLAALHLLYVNTRLLPAHVRPPRWRRAAWSGWPSFTPSFPRFRSGASLRVEDCSHPRSEGRLSPPCARLWRAAERRLPRRFHAVNDPK